jgi:hypothetical protein
MSPSSDRLLADFDALMCHLRDAVIARLSRRPPQVAAAVGEAGSEGRPPAEGAGTRQD